MAFPVEANKSSLLIFLFQSSNTSSHRSPFASSSQQFTSRHLQPTPVPQPRAHPLIHSSCLHPQRRLFGDVNYCLPRDLMLSISFPSHFLILYISLSLSSCLPAGSLNKFCYFVFLSFFFSLFRKKDKRFCNDMRIYKKSFINDFE